MRTTIEIPDELFREVKARAALEGRSLKQWVLTGLKLMLQEENAPRMGHTHFPLIASNDAHRRTTAEMIAAAEERMLAQEATTHVRVTRP
jgi:plasmid stability protein